MYLIFATISAIQNTLHDKHKIKQTTVSHSFGGVFDEQSFPFIIVSDCEATILVLHQPDLQNGSNVPLCSKHIGLFLLLIPPSVVNVVGINPHHPLLPPPKLVLLDLFLKR